MRRFSGVVAVLVVTIFAGALAGPAAARSGALDSRFGTMPGRTLAGVPDQSVRSLPLAMVGLTDGSTITGDLVGRDYRTALTRRTPDGLPDSRFGRNGSVLAPFANARRFQVQHLALQDGSVLVVGSGTDHRVSTYVQRFDADTGKWDQDFGNEGTATLAVRDFVKSNEDTYPQGVGVDSTGRIYLMIGNGYWQEPDLLVRLNPDGNVDESFGSFGAVGIPREGCFPFNDLAVTDDGVFAWSDDCVRSYDETGNARFTYKKTSDAPLDRHVSSVLGSPDGKTYLGVSGDDNPSTTRILELQSDGSVAPAFGGQGLVPTIPGDVERYYGNLTIDQQGRFLLADMPQTGTEEQPVADHSQAVLRLLPDGDPDGTFGVGGRAVIDPLIPNRSEYPAMVPGPDGVIVLGSSNLRGYPSLRKHAVRVGNDGTADSSFADEGLLRFRSSVPADDRIYDTVTIPGGGTLTAGKAEDRASFIKFRANGRIDRSFGENGRLALETGQGRVNDGARYLTALPDGSFAACINSGQSVQVAKIKPEGILDSGFGNDGIAPAPHLLSCAGIRPLGNRLLVSGPQTTSSFGVVRLSGNGSLDRGYGANGVAGGVANMFGKPSFAFTSTRNGSVLIADRSNLMKLDPTGSPDPVFGSDGSVELQLLPGGGSIRKSAAIVAGKTGAIHLAAHNGRFLVLAKFGRNGALIRKFGVRGVRVLKEPDGLVVRPTDLKVGRRGAMFISATAKPRRCGLGCSSGRIYRLYPDGRPDITFGRRGQVTFRFGPDTTADSLSLAPGGIVAGGYVETGTGRADSLILRLRR